MNLEQYQAATAETAIYPGQGSIMGLAYCGLKLNGEVAELLPTRNRELALKELGDVMWYTSQICTELGAKLGNFETTAPLSTVDTPVLLFPHSGIIAEQIGKAMRDDSGHVSANRCAIILDNIAMIVKEITGIAYILDSNLETVLDSNIAKLADRKARGVLQGSGDNR